MRPNTPIGYNSWEEKEATERLMEQRGQYIDKWGIVRKGIPPKDKDKEK